MNIHYDQKDGIGSIPFNQDVGYRGFKCWMFPDMFLRLARKIYIDPKDNYFLLMKSAIRKGKPIGSPYFDAIWDETKQVWEIDGHEGRHRAQAIKDLWPNEMIEVHVIPMGGIRARDITPEMLNSFMTNVIAEDDTLVKNPTAKIEHLNKPFNPNQPPEQPPQQPMMENDSEKYKISKMEESKAVMYIQKKLIPKLVEFYNEYNFKGKHSVEKILKTFRKTRRGYDVVGGLFEYEVKIEGESYRFILRKRPGGKITIFKTYDGTIETI